MIVGFGDAATKDLFNDERTARYRRFPADIVKPARRKLMSLNAATSVHDLRSPPGNKLEELQGDLAGFWSIRVNEQWRIIFRWSEGRALDVKLTDCH